MEGKGMVRGEGKGMSWGMGKGMGERKRDGGTDEKGMLMEGKVGKEKEKGNNNYSLQCHF